MQKIIYCKRCRNYHDSKDFYITQYGYFEHKRKLCKKSKKKNILWDDHKNPKVIAEMKDWYDKNEKQIRAYSRNVGRFNIQNLTPSYVKSILKDTGFTDEIIESYPELIKTKREIIKTNRLCKTSKN